MPMGRTAHSPAAHGTARRWVAGLIVATACFIWPLACARQHHPTEPPRIATNAPLVRVRLLAQQDQVQIKAAVPPTIQTATELAPLRLNIAAGAAATLALTPAGWQIGGVTVPGRGELTISPAEDASVTINDKPYRGRYRFVPVTVDKFDVVNDVNVDDYLKGVLARELPRGWNEETYRAQAIVARTYALFEAKRRGGTNWDLLPDQRSQVYGGYDDETRTSRAAADDTAGIVVAFGPKEHDRIFKSYFSSCCGGVTQSAADAFGETFLVPLSDQNVQGLCGASKFYNWGPVEITKDDLTRRLRAYGQRRNRGESEIGEVTKLEIDHTNRFNRPIRFVATDAGGTRYSLSGEELRNAVNGGATSDSPAHLYSSFFKIVNDPGSDVVRFVEGHGNGHGVGLCQYCAEARAEAGMRHEDIVLSAFPRAHLVRAY
jgi:stage II sporulation protein D